MHSDLPVLTIGRKTIANYLTCGTSFSLVFKEWWHVISYHTCNLCYLYNTCLTLLVKLHKNKVFYVCIFFSSDHLWLKIKWKSNIKEVCYGISVPLMWSRSAWHHVGLTHVRMAVSVWNSGAPTSVSVSTSGLILATTVR